MKTFLFGDIHSVNECETIIAKNIEQAIRVFKSTVIFPERYVPREFRQEKDRYFTGSSYTDLTTYDLLPGAYIPIFEKRIGKYPEVGRVDAMECVTAGIDPPLRKTGVFLLTSDESSPAEEQTQLPVVTNAANLITVDKPELRRMKGELAQRMQALEAQKRELQVAAKLLQEELARKRRLIYVIETYLGVYEEIVQIAEGTNAPEEEPLCLFQQVLYMDEEIGIWEEGGIDFHDLDVFDEWIAQNYDKFLYKPKSVVVFRVRRHEKDYGDQLTNFFANKENMRTYFLIRNGSNLYRIWSDVVVHQRLFPTKEEYNAIIEKGWGSEESRQEQVVRRHEGYLYGLFAIQGLIERTEIFGVTMRHDVSLPQNILGDRVILVRDDEPEYWLTDGRPGWKDYLKANQATITVGARVIMTKELSLFGKENDLDRFQPFTPGHAPSPKHIYQVVDERDVTYGSRQFKFFFRSDDVLHRYTWEEGHQWDTRKRRVPCWAYRDEVVNFDAMTLEDCEYYLHNRLERKYYLDMMKTIHFVRRMKLEERELEAEFAKFMLARLGWWENEVERVHEAIQWWKLKNKWKRTLMADDAKAVRMIERRLRKQQHEVNS